MKADPAWRYIGSLPVSLIEKHKTDTGYSRDGLVAEMSKHSAFVADMRRKWGKNG